MPSPLPISGPTQLGQIQPSPKSTRTRPAPAPLPCLFRPGFSYPDPPPFRQAAPLLLLVRRAAATTAHHRLDSRYCRCVSVFSVSPLSPVARPSPPSPPIPGPSLSPSPLCLSSVSRIHNTTQKLPPEFSLFLVFLSLGENATAHRLQPTDAIDLVSAPLPSAFFSHSRPSSPSISHSLSIFLSSSRSCTHTHTHTHTHNDYSSGGLLQRPSSAAPRSAATPIFLLSFPVFSPLSVFVRTQTPKDGNNPHTPTTANTAAAWRSTPLPPLLLHSFFRSLSPVHFPFSPF